MVNNFLIISFFKKMRSVGFRIYFMRLLNVILIFFWGLCLVFICVVMRDGYFLSNGLVKLRIYLN